MTNPTLEKAVTLLDHAIQQLEDYEEVVKKLQAKIEELEAENRELKK